MSLKSRKYDEDAPSECLSTDYNVLTSPAVLNKCPNAEPKRHYSIESVHNLDSHNLKPTTYVTHEK